MWKVNLVAVSLLLAASYSAGGQTIDFEQAEGFNPGGAWPAGWSSSSSSGGVAQVSTLHPTSGIQCVEFGAGMSGSASISYYPGWVIPADTKMRVQFDIRASEYGPPDDFNFSGYGGIYIYDQDYYKLGGVVLALEDYDGYDPVQADDFKLKFMYGSQMPVVGTFVPGTYYRYTLKIDRIINQITQRMEVIGGGTVAQQTYTYSGSSIPLIYFAGSQTPSTPAYADRLAFGAYSPADFGGEAGVDLLDFSILAAAWGSSAGPPADPAWNPACDLVPDGVIDMADLIAFSEEWLSP